MQFWISPSGHAWLRRIALLAAVVCALGAAPLSAQTASHQFFGSGAAGSGVFLDGEPAPEGTLVVAFNEDGWAITSDRIERGAWAIAVPATRAVPSGSRWGIPPSVPPSPSSRAARPLSI